MFRIGQEELDALEDEERVPIYLVFLLVLGYIILGAFMFSIWERWGPIEGAYFCFTTLTTIGKFIFVLKLACNDFKLNLL